jgi:hypothetical protein
VTSPDSGAGREREKSEVWNSWGLEGFWGLLPYPAREMAVTNKVYELKPSPKTALNPLAGCLTFVATELAAAHSFYSFSKAYVLP